MRIFASVTAHGLGHLAYTAPILNELVQRLHCREIYVRTGLPRERVENAIPGALVMATDDDFGIPMIGYSCASDDEIAARWLELVARAPAIIESIASQLVARRIDLVVSAICPWTLAAAKAVGVPGFGVGTFTWDGILEVLLAKDPRLQMITPNIAAAYQSSSTLFALRPGLGISHTNAKLIETTIATIGVDRRDELRNALGASQHAKIVVLAFGGMAPDRPPSIMIDPSSWLVLAPTVWSSNPGFISVERAHFSFADLLASADLVVSKAGYGIVCELAALGVASIVVRRPDWPEDLALIGWLKQFVNCREIVDLNQLTPKLIDEHISSLPIGRPPPDRNGEQDIANLICTHLDA